MNALSSLFLLLLMAAAFAGVTLAVVRAGPAGPPGDPSGTLRRLA